MATPPNCRSSNRSSLGLYYGHLKTAKVLGLTIAESFLQRADEVID